MAKKRHPKNKDEAVNIWVVEQYYHGDALTQSWGKPLSICYSEQDAFNTWNYEINNYISNLTDPSNIVIDTDIPHMVTIRFNKENICPSMDFWYYQCILVDPEENID